MLYLFQVFTHLTQTKNIPNILKVAKVISLLNYAEIGKLPLNCLLEPEFDKLPSAQVFSNLLTLKRHVIDEN